ncbi:MAG: hypothetical protein UR26_C0001G0182 [candidate division TM6 bacterium GW2011_GWF2_32_72]|nr:MAG: hypothetical protein UR26_C0001G0182 [candidate division TM6 bacterium GW2011_GWF2_32_72]
MNEFLLLFHAILASAITLIAAKLGKEALTGVICMQFVLANIFICKQINLFGLAVTSSDAYFISSALGLNLLREYFGKSAAQKGLQASIFCSTILPIMSSIQLWYQPNTFDSSHCHFLAILASTPRIIFASFFSYGVSQIIEYLFYGWLQKAFSNKHIIFRNIMSLSLVQFIDTVLFSFVGLYGIVGNIGQLIVFSYLIKLITIGLETPVLGLTKKFNWLKKHE